jgi:hypothetical protein
MRTLTRFALTLGLAAALAVPALAQRQPGQGRGQFGGGFGGIAGLLRNESVQKELKMDKDQTDKVAEATKKVQDKHADEFAKLRELPQEERRSKSAELNRTVSAETLTAVSEVLKPEQVTRLKEIELQQAGVAVFTRPDVEKTLALNDEQKGKLKVISDESATKTRELFGAGGRGPGAGGARPPRGQGGTRGAGPNQEKITALRKEMSEKALAVLNDDQKKTWKTMTGAAFTIAPRTPPKKDD